MSIPDPPGIAENRARQAELYGAPLGERVRRLTTGLHITQARLARVLGISPAMLSQLVSGRRVKIGDPAVLARLLLLGQRWATLTEPGVPLPARTVDVLLSEVARAHWQWSPAAADPPVARRAEPPVAPSVACGTTAADALRRIAAPARLAAAAATLGPGFPELAEVLRQAAARPG